MKEPLTKEGELISQALEALRIHLESHQCSECLDNYETTIRAITEWLQPNQEESHGNEKESSKKNSQGEDPQTQGSKKRRLEHLRVKPKPHWF